MIFFIVIATLILIGISIPLKINGNEGKALLPVKKNPLESLSKTPTPEEIKEAAVFLANNLDLNQNQFLKTIDCESGFQYDPPGWNDAGAAYGVAQFHRDTFNTYCYGDYISAKDQLICMAYMWKVKIKYPWTCWKD